MVYLQKILIILLSFILFVIQSYACSVDIIINQNDHTISVSDTCQRSKDSTRYDYISPNELKIFIINKTDTNCVFTAPCVTEYDIQNKESCIIYLWPTRIICPDDCVCFIEDEDDEINCYKRIDDAEICIYINFINNETNFCIVPQVNLLENAISYSQSLFADIEAQKKYGTYQSALFWANVYETIIHNSLLFHLFANKNLQSKEMSILSANLSYFDDSPYSSHNTNLIKK